MLHTVKQVSGGILWFNLHLLFWLSLVPFTTGWMGENNFAPVPLALYGVVLLMAGVSYYLLQQKIIRTNGGKDSVLAKAIGRDLKGKSSPVLYSIAIASTTISPWIAGSIYVFVAMMWLIPDKRIERMINDTKGL
jgi:uncharacterized membrane protein